MKVYIVTATINGGECYLVRKLDDTKNPFMQGGANDIFHATIFRHRQDALNAIDDLRYGIGKTSRLLTVEINEEVQSAL